MPLIQAVLGNANSYGLYDLLLPWLFGFALVYGVLSFVPPFGDDKRLRSIISFVTATYLINYTPVGTSVGGFFTNLFGQGIFILAGILLGLMLVGLVFGEKGWESALKEPLKLLFSIFGIDNPGGQEILIVGALLLVGIIVMIGAANSFGMALSMGSGLNVDSDVIWGVALIGIAIGAVLFMTK